MIVHRVLTMPLSVVSLTVACIGCGHPIGGMLYGTDGGHNVVVIDGVSGRKHEVARWTASLQPVVGLSDQISGEVFISGSDVDRPYGESRIRAINVRNGNVRIWGRGVYPTVSHTARAILYYADQAAKDSVIGLVMRGHAEDARPETLGYVRPLSRSGSWWRGVSAPVEIDSGFVATVGPDGAVWKVHPVSRRWRRIGERGLLPRWWHADGRVLVCSGGDDLLKVVALRDGGRSVRTLETLNEMIAYGEGPKNRSFVVVPGWPAVFVDSWTLKSYDWSSGRMSTVRVGTHMSGRVVWSR
jgi:hypothetical protein